MGGCVRTPLAGKSDHLVELVEFDGGGDDVGSNFGWTCGGTYRIASEVMSD